MKTIIFVWLGWLSGSGIVTGDQQKGGIRQVTTTPVEVPVSTVKGDFDGDGQQELMWLVSPAFNADSTECAGECISKILFSDPKIPEIRVESIGGEPVNLHDLNGKGTDEIGLLTESFAGSWHLYYVWTLVNGTWKEAVKPFMVHYSQLEDGVPPIQQDPDTKGNVLINYSTNDGVDIVSRSKSVKIER